jgi:hypothetical protein
MHNLRSLYALIAVQTVGLIATLALVVVVFMGSIDSVSSEQLAACQATNITRALENISHLADYHVYSFIAARFLIPTKTETAKQRQITMEFAGQLRASITAKTWSQLTDCRAEAHYPIEVYAISRRLPPASVLNLANAAMPDPIGSSG